MADLTPDLIYLGEPYLSQTVAAPPREVTCPMYVCVCHAVTEEDVRGHVASGAASAKAVRTACGMRPGCGACVKRIRALLAERAAECAADGPVAGVTGFTGVAGAVGAAAAVSGTAGAIAAAGVVAERVPAA